MKTISTLIIALTTLILSTAVMYYSITTAINISTIFYNNVATESFTFSFTFAWASVSSFIFGSILILTSIKYYLLHRKYYHTYLYNKRDRDIKEKVETAKYHHLYEDLRLTCTIEQKEEILTAFYSTKDIVKQADSKRIVNMVDKLKTKLVPSTIKETQTPHSLMGFTDIIFDRKDSNDTNSIINTDTI